VNDWVFYYTEYYNGIVNLIRYDKKTGLININDEKASISDVKAVNETYHNYNGLLLRKELDADKETIVLWFYPDFSPFYEVDKISINIDETFPANMDLFFDLLTYDYNGELIFSRVIKPVYEKIEWDDGIVTYAYVIYYPPIAHPLYYRLKLNGFSWSLNNIDFIIKFISSTQPLFNDLCKGIGSVKNLINNINKFLTENNNVKLLKSYTSLQSPLLINNTDESKLNVDDINSKSQEQFIKEHPIFDGLEIIPIEKNSIINDTVVYYFGANIKNPLLTNRDRFVIMPISLKYNKIDFNDGVGVVDLSTLTEKYFETIHYVKTDISIFNKKDEY
jgi:hypothetical protein